jgi:pimeloyl-ACP methyl ester carboxylesterase
MADLEPFGIKRAFVDIEEGQIHYRHIPGEPGLKPIFILHLSPGSSRGQRPLLGALKSLVGGRPLIAPDMPTNGDSTARTPEAPDIVYYAQSLMRVFDALKVERADVYGIHTGGRIASEAAILFPDRVDRIAVDGVDDFLDEAEREHVLKVYAPEKKPDEYGAHFLWAFNFVRDMSLHSPYYMRDPEHRLMSRPVPSPDELHGMAVELLKSVTTYHKAYNAAFLYSAAQRFPKVRQPTLVLDGMHGGHSNRLHGETLANILPQGVFQSPASLEDKAAAIATFFS